MQVSLFFSKLSLVRLKNSHSEKSPKKEKRKKNYLEIVKTSLIKGKLWCNKQNSKADNSKIKLSQHREHGKEHFCQGSCKYQFSSQSYRCQVLKIPILKYLWKKKIEKKIIMK